MKKKEIKDPKEHKPNWREYTATVEDIERFLSDHVLLRYNVVAGRVECRIPESDVFAEWIAAGLPTDQWLPISDRIVNTLWRAMSKVKKVNTRDIYNIIESDHSELELVDLFFRKPRGREPRQVVSATMALQAVGGNIAHMLSKEKIGQAFTKLGFEYKRTASQRGYIAILRTGAEMDAYRQKLAEENPMTDDSMTEVY